MAAKHVFLSYSRDNRSEVSQLRDDLIAAGETVWWDGLILPGQNFKHAISQAMKESYAFVLCLSKELEQRNESGVYPELLNAIATYRKYKPGSGFIFPVRLSDCNIPDIQIDETTNLDMLQHVDLFPPAERAEGLSRLVQALRSAPHHP